MGSTFQEIEIAAPADKVWQTIRDFHDVSWAPNVVTSVDVVGDKSGDQKGAGRVLNGVFHETLRMLDDVSKTFTYSIDEGPGPLSDGQMKNYVGRVVVEHIAGGTRVEWTSNWQENDEAIYEFCHPIYVALLDDLKASLEG
ncbi:MAG: SRPBCC family protein [Woeseiaceae bacterium]|nr:SRPBCC family protein [Woeseiaceae bacterium]